MSIYFKVRSSSIFSEKSFIFLLLTCSFSYAFRTYIFLVQKLEFKNICNHNSEFQIPTRSLISKTNCRLEMGLYPMITSLNLLNKASWRSLVKKSANICKVGQYYTIASPLSTLSFTKKYLMLMCLEFSVHEFLPFFNMRIVLWLSWYKTLCLIS